MQLLGTSPRAGDTIDLVLHPTHDLPFAPDAKLAMFVNDLLDQSVVLPEEWDELDPAVRDNVYSSFSQNEILKKLEALHLLTHFQAETIRKGGSRDLRLGHYRILGLLGRGGMGVVYRAENTYLRREVAVKVFANAQDACPKQLRRFYSEARAVARLHHPHLVACLDAGRHTPPDPGSPTRDYYVMEMVNGEDLQSLVRSNGPLALNRACELFRMIAEALAEAHRHGLIHRDIKPSNILVTPDWQAKLLDFGLALHPQVRMTEPGTLLGTVGYMAPEQVRDAQNVDARADLFGLGAVMFWSLTGREPFEDTGDALRDLHKRLTSPPPTVQQFRPELPEELCTLVNRMLSTDPDERPPSARVVAITLAGFNRWAARAVVENAKDNKAAEKPNILLVEDDAALRKLQRMHLGDEYAIHEAEDGERMMAILQTRKTDLIVLDINLPGTSGYDMVETIRANYPDSDGPMIMLTSGLIPQESLGGLLTTGADDFLAKPFTRTEFRSRIRGLLGRKLNTQTRTAAKETTRIGMASLTRSVASQAEIDLGFPAAPPTNTLSNEIGSIGVLNVVLSQLLNETLSFGPHYPERLRRYIRALAATVAEVGEYSRLKDARYLEMLSAVAPLHDLGMAAIPQTILRKPAALDDQERMVVQAHAVMGSEWLTAAAAKCPEACSLMTLAAEVVRSHHERWDGAGYPDGESGDRIPLSARVVGMISVYDALRSRRVQRPGLSHARVIRMMTTELEGQFDPTLVAAFGNAATRFEKIYQMTSD